LPAAERREAIKEGSMTKQTISIATRTSDGAITVKFNGRSVVTITKSGKKARITGKNMKPIPPNVHRGVNKFQFDL
jgi:hypothetical protein